MKAMAHEIDDKHDDLTFSKLVISHSYVKQPEGN
jgi:hypothetical protein